MTTGLLKDILQEIPRKKALLGMDVGKKTIGLAVSDPDLTIATPLKTINRIKFTKDMQDVTQIIKDYEIGGFIIGLPLNMDGSEGPRCQSVRDFAAEMEKYFNHGDGVNLLPPPLWIAFWDERLSTEAVYDLLGNSVDINRSKAKSRGVIDKLAAQNILKGALDFMNATGQFS